LIANPNGGIVSTIFLLANKVFGFASTAPVFPNPINGMASTLTLLANTMPLIIHPIVLFPNTVNGPANTLFLFANKMTMFANTGSVFINAEPGMLVFETESILCLDNPPSRTRGRGNSDRCAGRWSADFPIGLCPAFPGAPVSDPARFGFNRYATGVNRCKKQPAQPSLPVMKIRRLIRVTVQLFSNWCNRGI